MVANFCRKITFSKLFCLLKFVSILSKEKILLVSIWEPIMSKISKARNAIVKNMASCFSYHWRRHLILVTSIWKHLNNFFLTSFFFVSSHVLATISKNPIIHFLVSKFIFNSINVAWNTKSMSYSSTMTSPCSQSMKEDTKWRLLNLGSNIRVNILCFFFFIFFHKGKKRIQIITHFFPNVTSQAH